MAGTIIEQQGVPPRVPEAEIGQEGEAQTAGQLVDVDEDEFLLPGQEPEGVEEQPDGSVMVTLDDQPDIEENPEFYSNLAEYLDESTLNAIATDLWDRVDIDKTSCEQRIEQYARALRAAALDGQGQNGADFEGASLAAHPMMIEACIDFSARAIKELWPVGGQDGGPVKMQTLGDATKVKAGKAKRKSRHMNWQLTKQMKGFRHSLEQNLTQVPMAGASYLKLAWDLKRKRPNPIFVGGDRVYMNYDAGSFWDADRITHRITLTGLKFKQQVRSGLYRDVGDERPPAPEATAVQEATDRIQGVSASHTNEDDTRDVYEVSCYLEVDDDEFTGGEIAPYLVTLDHDGKTVLSIYRNWEEDDPDMEIIHNLVEWGFIPWSGARPIGLPHLIGSISTAAQGALRGLLDSAHVNNTMSVLKLKGGWAGGQEVHLEPTGVTEVGGANQSDDIRKVAMAVPFNPPSNVLFQLLGFLTEQGKGVIQTSFEKLSDQNPNQPVGTTLALIEQGMVVFSSIHARLHQAMERTLEILHTLNRLHLKDAVTLRETGELLARRSDYEGPMDVCPVSDPNIFSEAQRMAQAQMVAQRAGMFPHLYDLRKVEELLLERTKIPGAVSLLLPKPEPKRLNPVNENVAAAMGQPIAAFPDQNHEAHLRTHIDFLTNPMFGANPLIAPQFAPVMVDHLKQHIVLWYIDVVVELGTRAAGVDVATLMDDDPVVGSHYDDFLASLSSGVLARSNEVLGPLRVPETIQTAMQLLEQFKQQQPMDPNQAKAMAETNKAKAIEQKTQTDAQKAQAEQAQIALKGQDIQMRREENQTRAAQAANEHMQEVRLREQENAQDGEIAVAKLQSDERRNNADNITALTIAEGEWANNEEIGVSTGSGINPGS